MQGIWCLDPYETLGPGQMDEIERLFRDYPKMNDNASWWPTLRAGWSDLSARKVAGKTVLLKG
jgi:hypothetical protein